MQYSVAVHAKQDPTTYCIEPSIPSQRGYVLSCQRYNTNTGSISEKEEYIFCSLISEHKLLAVK